MKYLFFLAVLGLVSGCATPIKSTHINDQQPLLENEGVVAVQVVNNAGQLGQFHRNWTEVIAVRLDNMAELKAAAVEKAQKQPGGKVVDEDKVDWEPDVFSLAPSSQGMIDSQVYLGRMPAGRYMISSLFSFFTNGDMSSWISMPVGHSAGTFEVKGGQMTYLDTLVFQPLLSIKESSFWSSRSSQKAFVTRIPSQQDIVGFTKELYPNLVAKLSSTTLLGWNDDPLNQLRIDLGQLSRQNAFANRFLPLQLHGKGIVAARFGQLRVLPHQGEWIQVDLPTNAQISAVLEAPDYVAVGGELGQVFVAPSFATEWRQISPVSADEAIVWFGRDQHAGYAMSASNNEFRLYRFDHVEAPWQQIRQFDKKSYGTFLNVDGNVFAFVKKSGGLKVINNDLHYDYDAEANAWQEAKGDRFNQISQLASGNLVAIETSQWDGIGDQLMSTDDGASWQVIPRSLNLFGDAKADASLPAMLSAQDIVTVGRVQTSSESKRELRLLLSSNQGQSWLAKGLVDKSCATLIPELSNQQAIYLLCDQGTIVTTSDLGESWHDAVTLDLGSIQAQFEALIEALKEPTS
ncbi:hypothetical protein GCM10011369_32790 [Neiella marina]|uniref:Uncharacterized protein n=1 Tax=Neiella marina TaxID=508461 RepID=A0A8J2XRS3_9GAMM|nr:hypothetical protein [Neiella marina]GGA88119.1 hypothetical protein GCM10011369_32790 [Neiella marina]